MTAASSYIAYARALNRLGWTPAEFVVAESFAVRLRGMLGRSPIAANRLPLVMAFPRCSSVHTCFMAYPIDIAFIDRNGSILACYENVRPWRMCSCPGAWAVLERPSILATPPAFQQVPAQELATADFRHTKLGKMEEKFWQEIEQARQRGR